MVEEENIRLHIEDAISTKLWVDQLKVKNINTFYKDKLDLPPSGSKLQGEDFIMCIQTAFQVDALSPLLDGSPLSLIVMCSGHELCHV